MRRSFVLVCAVLACVLPGVLALEAYAEPLTEEGVVKMAAASAPEVLIAETRLLEARGHLAGARALGVDNPVIEGHVGGGATSFYRNLKTDFGTTYSGNVAALSNNDGLVVASCGR